MFSYHLQTEHSWESVRGGSTMDWSSQPAVFKHYPDAFPRFSLADLPKVNKFLQLSCGLSARKTYPGGEYFLRVNPSAGALYPCELYLQARNVPGLDNGIYHFEPLSRDLRLLHPLEDDQGIEACWEERGKVSGMVLLVSAIYYRSSWKYGSRALRYCLLDSGHLVGAVEAAACCLGQPFALIHRFDHARINHCLGFRGREMVTAVVLCGRQGRDTVSRLDMKLPFVDGTGFHRENSQIEDGYAAAAEPVCGRGGMQAVLPWEEGSAELEQAIWRRRSIREFRGRAMSRRQYDAVLAAAQAGLETDCTQQLTIWSVINRVQGLQPGLYQGQDCLREGDFSALAGYLCLEQALGADSGATFFLTAATGDYLALMLKAGLVGQRIYLAAEMAGVGCSGIGAFYDREVQEFLQTEEMVLYALAVGL